MDPSSEPPRPAMTTSTVDPPPFITTAHLARFEFSDHGTKILMVEWHPGGTAAEAAPPGGAANEAYTRAADPVAPNPEPASASPTGKATQPALDAAAWEVSWPGKSTFLPARDTDEDEAGPRRRVYFLLPPEAPIPATVTITGPGRSSWIVKPMPAIFPDGFDAEAGTRGVLHTLWAKKRLFELEREMKAELRANAESVGLEMAMAEKQWIMDNFLRPPPAPLPMSPRSPVPGRLGDKLKGLRLATSPADLVPSPTANTFTGTDIPSHTLSPLGGDIAVPSFSAMSRGNGHAYPMSLDAAVKGDSIPPNTRSRDGEDDLFALPISPRSPDMKKSPFSALA
ncbi:hypothetical protein TOPH_04916 [Tolypocladium ophioglossoides CBS 100239]|uniref:Uncharacterized protein n=1 Tax=Tolypocladium ophioglossoides (strain CBS 100239) TaxID=1163406 RepID=A0A0L0N867_TOLOC|nr:hypothetical protein TOPH_04916 [Tolypocladium ophioglossoides CBS 100239]